VDFKSLPELGNGKPGWRGPELLEWAEYIENGGMIMPMSVLAQEGSKII